jgi:hypothetical protein
MIRYGSPKMLKGMIDGGEFTDHNTFPNRDLKHKTVLDKLRDTNDPDYAHYRDKRLDPRIDHAETLPKGSKERTKTAYDIAGDRHASMDHLKWAVMNASVGTMQVAFNNQNANKRVLANHLFTHTMNHPMGRQVRSFLRQTIPNGELHHQMDKFEQTLPPEQRSKVNP